VGSFDLEKTKPLLTTYLGSLPSTGKTSIYKDAGVRPVKGPLKKEIKKGIESNSIIRLFWNGEIQYSERETLELKALAAVMNIRILENLREKLGGIYTGGMYGQVIKRPYSHYSIEVELPCGPENVAKLIAATWAEIDKVKAEGPRKEDLDKVKNNLKQQYDVDSKDNFFLVNYIIEALMNDFDLSSTLVSNYKNCVDALTPKGIQNAAIRYLDVKNYVQIVLNPEK
jgi:zinc protease